MKILIFLIPLLPLLVSTSLVFPYITGKNFAFRIIVGLAAALWISLAVINKEYRPRTSVITISILTFTFIVGLADLLGINPYKSFWSNYERMEGYITILHLTIYYLILISVLRTKKDWKVFFSLILLTSVVVALFSFVPPLSEDDLSIRRYIMEYGTRAYSTIGNPPFLAAYLLLSAIIGIILIINEKRYYLRCIFVATVLLNAVTIYLTATRGAIIGVIAGLITFICFYYIGMKRGDKGKYIKIVSLTSVILLAVVLIIFYVTNDYGSIDQNSTVYRFKTMFSDSSVLTRLDVWKKAITAIKERPLLGWGQENFIAIYTVNPIDLVPEHIWLDRAHNIVIDWLVNAGFLGLFSYLAIFASAVYVTWSAYSRQRISIVEEAVIFSALAAYLIQNLSLFDTVNSYMIFFALLAYIDTLDYFDKPLSAEPELGIDAGITKTAYASTILIALMLFSIICYYLNYKPMKQNRHIIKMGVSSSDNDSYYLLLDDFDHALSIHILGGEFLRKSMLSVSSKLLRMKAFDREGALRFIEATLRELEKGIALNRHNLEYLTKVIIFFSGIAEYESSYIARTEALIKACKDLNPEYQWLDMIMTDVLILRKDYEGAFNNIKEIADEYPDDDMTQMKLALTAILASKEDTVRDAFRRVEDIRTASNMNIASGRAPVFSFDELWLIAENYMLINDLPVAMHYYKMITRFPEEHLADVSRLRIAEAHHKMSAIYLSLGEKNKADQEAEKATKKVGKSAESGRKSFFR